MTGVPDNTTDRLLELLAERAMHGLSPQEQEECASLLAEMGREFDAESLDRAAAALDTAWAAGETSPEEMPASLRRLVETQGVAITQGAAGGRASPDNPVAGRIGGRGLRGISAWWLAAATVVGFLIGAWPTVLRLAPKSTESRLVEMVRSARDLVQWRWESTGELAESEVGGEVFWSTAKQEGFMRFVGLPKNDPRTEQYQLWIFDPAQSEATPIDGGVFDVDERGEVIVRIDPKLRVTGPTLFAVTIEKPGGVVVSDRSRLVLIAKPS